MTVSFGVPQLLAVLLLMAAGELVVGRRRFHPVVRAASLVPGAALMLGWTGIEPLQAWSVPVLVATVAAVGPAAVAVDARHGPTGIGPGLLAACSGGIYACVPETDHVLVVIGGCGALVLAATALRLPLGAGGTVTLLAVLAWAALTGGTYRDGAVVGSVGVLALLAVEPVARAVADRTMVPGRPLPPWLRPPVLVAGHAAACLVVSRTAGLMTDAVPAAITAVVLVTVAVGAAAVALVPRPAQLLAPAETVEVAW